MQFRRPLLAAASLAIMPFLTGCIPALLVTGAAAGVVSAHDRRSTGVQTDDEVSEWKGGNRLPSQYGETAHINFTAFNRILLVTGEVPDAAAKQTIGNLAANIEGITSVRNEVVIAPVAPLSSRGKDALISANFKTRLIDAKGLSPNHIKPLTENGVLFLMGLVNESEAREAIRVARTTDGVREVVSVLEVVPEAETRRIDALFPIR